MRSFTIATSVLLLVVVVTIVIVAVKFRTVRFGWTRVHSEGGPRPFSGCQWGGVLSDGVRLFDSESRCTASIGGTIAEPIGDNSTHRRPTPPPLPRHTRRTSVPGVIMIISCEKHLTTRVSNVNIRGSFDGWPVVVVTGDITLAVSHEFREGGRRLVVCCEDSYIHLMKKVVMAIEALLSVYDMTYGVLRCGDDLVFDTKKLSKELKTIVQLGDYVGTNASYEPSIGVRVDYFMLDYYTKHANDFSNPSHGLSEFNIDDIETMGIMPRVPYAVGVVFYLSVFACETLVGYMRSEPVSMNIFTPVTFGGRRCFPFTIEDIGIGYIMHVAGIALVNRLWLFSQFSLTHSVALHTNSHK